MTTPINIAIDGFSSTGKSTLAKQLAAKLGYRYIDSGAMYRAVAYFALEHGWLGDEGFQEDQLLQHLDEVVVNFVHNPATNRSEVVLNGKNIEEEIRGMRVSQVVSKVSAVVPVRQKMVKLQQAMGREKAVVMDGRDIGTVVFPNAELKIFMTADPAVRAKRRYDELIAKGQSVSYEEVAANLSKRDAEDMARSEGPLRQAEDAIVVDNSHLSPTEQLELILGLAQQKVGS